MSRFSVRDREQGEEVQVNTWALLDDRLELPGKSEWPFWTRSCRNCSPVRNWLAHVQMGDETT